MKIFRLLSIAAALFLFNAVGQPLQAQNESTTEDFDFEFIRDLPGPTASENEHVTFHIRMMGETSEKEFVTVWSTPENNGGQPVHLQLPHPDSISFPEVISIFKMSVGDSLHCWQQNSVKDTSSDIFRFKVIHYYLGISKIESDSLYQLREAQETAEAKIVSERVGQEMAKILTQHEAGALTEELTVYDRGLKKLIVEKGTGPPIEANDVVTTHYYGIAPDGRYVDDSYSERKPFAVPLGKRYVIDGWEKGIATMCVGERAVFFIPAEMAYGANGIPPAVAPNEDLIYLIEVLSAQ